MTNALGDAVSPMLVTLRDVLGAMKRLAIRARLAPGADKGKLLTVAVRIVVNVGSTARPRICCA